MSSDLIWGMYDELYSSTDSLEEGLERFNPARFKRTYNVFRMNHFAGRIVTFDPKVELPIGSILHVIDDASHPNDHSDVPRIEENIFIQRESFRKFLYHVREPNLNGPLTFDDKYIYRPAGLPSILMKYRSQQGNKFRYCATLDELPLKREALIVINHNPLFRARFLGRLQYFRKIQLVLTSVLNTVVELTKLNKTQYIVIPWGETIYQKQEFIRSREKLTPVTVKHPEDWHYIVMMHIVNFLWNDATTSLFKQLPEEALNQLNLILELNGKYIIYNLADILALNIKNRAYLRCINQMNMLSVVGRLDPEANVEEQQQVKQVLETYFDKEQVADPADTEEDKTETYRVKEEVVPSTATTGTVTQDEKVEAIINHVSAKVPVVNKVKEVARKITTSTIAPVTRTIQPTKSKVVTATTRPQSKPVTNSSKEINPLKTDISAKEWVNELDTETDTFIDNVEFLTPAQKRRAQVLSRKYKTLELNGRKIEDILTQDVDLSIDDRTLSDQVLGMDLPDQSGLKSSLVAYDKAYMEKTYQKHFAGVITSFQRNGVFLTGVKSHKVVSELNNYTDYALQYEDLEGKKSTVKFRIPTVDKEGRVNIDGIKKVLKKQRITLPIVKINDTEVSLSSNYNKTRVVRNTTKAHSYFDFIDNLINDTSKSNAHIVFGTCVLQEFPVAYEYAVLAERYKTVDFTKDGDHYSLFFDYPQRLTHFQENLGNEQELKTLEENYGVYCGASDDNWYFINNLNEVAAVRKQGGEVVDNQLHTLLDIFKLSLKEGVVIKQLTEYVSIKILDANLPVIFMLAYRFGLRNILDFLGLKYTITENGRSRNIVVEDNLVAGTEDITEERKYTPKDGDISIKFADKTLWFNRYPLRNSLIVSGLDSYDLTSYEMNEFESKDIYYQLLLDKGMSINYLKGIDSFYDLFIDNMTYSVLKQMHEPTTVRELLVRATEMLTTLDYRVPSARANHRIRGYEQFNAILYNEMSRQFAAYQSRRGRNNKFTVNPDAIYLRIVQNASMIPSESPNPLQDIKEQSYMTYAGVGGRTSESFVVNDRRYAKDDVGVISEATVDNAKVGINAQLSLDPAIINTEGLLGETKDPQPANIFSIYGLVFPFLNKEDSKRINISAFIYKYMSKTL